MEEATFTQKIFRKSFKTYEEAVAFIKKFEKVSRNDYYVSSTSIGVPDEELTTLANKKIRFPTEEVPYVHIINGKSYRSCSLGGRSARKKLLRKSSGGEIKTRKRKLEVEDVPICPAGVTIRSLVIFPELKASIGMAKHAKRKTTEMLRINFSPTMPHENLFIVEINDNHTSHRKNALEKVDQKVVDMMQTLVERGYYAPIDVSDRLKKFVAKLEDCPNTSLPSYSPNIERIRKLVYPLVVKQRNLEREKGFVPDINEALERMKELEFETETSFIYEGIEDFGTHDVYQACKGKIINTAPDRDLRCRLDTDGVPYVILETRQYECSHGVDYKNKFIVPFTQSQRKHMNKEGMMMCTARCTFKEIVLFPGYRIDDTLTERGVRDKIMGRLRQDLDERKAEYEKGYAFAFPVVEEHCGHPVREANGHLFVDEAIKSQISELVEEGVQSLSEMRRHLKMYLKHTFDEDSMPGPFNKRYRPSNQTLMNLMYDAGIAPEDIVQDISDPVPYISRPSAYRDISTRIEERRKKSEANAAISVITDGGSVVETTYDTLLDNLDIFQNIQGSPKVGARQGMSPSKAHTGNSRAGADKTRETGDFSEGLFRKQSECQALLEELLQVVYELTDLFRVRDMHHHLKKVIEYMRAGRLLCDVIPLKRKQATDKTDSAANSSATAINIENGVPTTVPGDEPPTKLLIMDQNDQVTEVDLPKDIGDSEIVIYQQNDENGEQIYVIPSESVSEENKVKEEEKDSNPAAIRQRQKKEESRKDTIKIRCQQFFEKDDVLKNLDISLQKPGARRRNYNVSCDTKIELQNQKEEFLRYEREKRNLNLMEIKVRNEEIQLQDILSDVNTKQVNKPHPVGKPEPVGDTDEVAEIEDMDSDTYAHEEMEIDTSIGEDGQKGIASDIIKDHQYFGSGKSKSTSQSHSTDESSCNTDNEISDSNQTPSQEKQVENVKSKKLTAVSDSTAKVSDSTAKVSDSTAKENNSRSAPSSPNFFVSVMNDIVKSNSSKDKNKSVAKTPSTGASKVLNTPTVKVPSVSSSLNLKAGDTIRFQPNPFNPVLNNQCLTGNLIPFNNVLYAQTPYGLIPTFGVPVVLQGQGQQFIPGGALVGVPTTQAQTATDTQKITSTPASNDKQSEVAVVTESTTTPISHAEMDSNKKQPSQAVTDSNNEQLSDTSGETNKPMTEVDQAEGTEPNDITDHSHNTAEMEQEEMNRTGVKTVKVKVYRTSESGEIRPKTSTPSKGDNSETQTGEAKDTDNTESTIKGINEESQSNQGDVSEGNIGSTNAGVAIDSKITEKETVVEGPEKTACQTIIAGKPVARVNDAHIKEQGLATGKDMEKIKVTKARVQIPNVSIAPGIVLKTITVAKNVVSDSPKIVLSPSLKKDTSTKTIHPPRKTTNTAEAASQKIRSTVRKPVSSPRSIAGQISKESNPKGAKEVYTPPVSSIPYVKIEKIFQTKPLSKEKTKIQKDVNLTNKNTDKSQKDQSPASSKASEQLRLTPTITMRTRGRQMKFSKSGEKLE